MLAMAHAVYSVGNVPSTRQQEGLATAGEPEVGVLQRQAALRGILRRQPPPALHAMLRHSVTWAHQPPAAGNADPNSPRRDSQAWLRRVSDLPEHELQQRRQVHGVP